MSQDMVIYRHYQRYIRLSSICMILLVNYIWGLLKDCYGNPLKYDTI